MSDTLPDIDRLEAVYDHILADPEHHSQAAYGKTTSCGAVHCFAGWAIVLFGELEYRFDPDRLDRFVDARGETVSPSATAAKLLGLRRDDMIQAVPLGGGHGGLFSATTPLEGIRWWIDHFRAEVGLPPREFRTDRNIDLMERVWDQICEHPELYDQDMYSVDTACGTALCIAGWTVVLGAGWTVEQSFFRDQNGDLWYGNQLDQAAYNLLGITSFEAWGVGGLFSPSTLPLWIRDVFDRFRIEAGLPKRVGAPVYRVR